MERLTSEESFQVLRLMKKSALESLRPALSRRWSRGCARGLIDAGWQFMKDHPFGVSPEPYANGLPTHGAGWMLQGHRHGR